MYIKRRLAIEIRRLLNAFPIVSVTGPRQSGKTTMLREEFSDYSYVNLERPDILDNWQADPRGFLRQSGEKVIFDEAQRFPQLFSYLQSVSDEKGTPGQYILSASQSFLLNEKISQSLAGRVAVLQLLPLDPVEYGFNDITDPPLRITRGAYPRVWEQHAEADDFYAAYTRTYVERDLRSISNIGDLHTFRRFLRLCAGRIGQVLNMSSLANDTGISVPTLKKWLSILEASYIIFLLQPYYRNFSQRLIKAPKLYFHDTGLASFLLNIRQPEDAKTHYNYGSLFENLVINDILKSQYHHGHRPSAYYWRNSNGNEIDLLLEKSPAKLYAIEIKGGETINRNWIKELKKFPPKPEDLNIHPMLIYAGSESMTISDIPFHAYSDLPRLITQFTPDHP